jgi:hypothetical protein
MAANKDPRPLQAGAAAGGDTARRGHWQLQGRGVRLVRRRRDDESTDECAERSIGATEMKRVVIRQCPS